MGQKPVRYNWQATRRTCFLGQEGPIIVEFIWLGRAVAEYLEYTDQVCRNPSYNLDTRHVVLSDERTDIRRLLNNTRISRTTNTQAFAAGYIRAEIRKHLLSCIDHATSACKPWKGAPARAGG
jgi:hypothetical protein